MIAAILEYEWRRSLRSPAVRETRHQMYQAIWIGTGVVILCALLVFACHVFFKDDFFTSRYAAFQKTFWWIQTLLAFFLFRSLALVLPLAVASVQSESERLVNQVLLTTAVPAGKIISGKFLSFVSLAVYALSPAFIGFAALEGFHVQGVAEHNRNLFLTAQIDNPVPGEQAFDRDREIGTIRSRHLQEELFVSGDLCSQHDVAGLIDNADRR